MWLVVGLLCVVGLLIATLTWRYWWFTSPRRGFAKSRALMHQRALDDALDSEVLRVWEDGQTVESPVVPLPGSPALPPRMPRAGQPAPVYTPDPAPSDEVDTLPTGIRVVRPANGADELGAPDGVDRTEQL